MEFKTDEEGASATTDPEDHVPAANASSLALRFATPRSHRLPARDPIGGVCANGEEWC